MWMARVEGGCPRFAEQKLFRDRHLVLGHTVRKLPRHAAMQPHPVLHAAANRARHRALWRLVSTAFLHGLTEVGSLAQLSGLA